MISFKSVIMEVEVTGVDGTGGYFVVLSSIAAA
jgi:hypothetical protein